jgi:hypothetical protein
MKALAAADGVIALALGLGIAISSPMMGYQFLKTAKLGFPAVSLPGLRLSPRAHPKPMIRGGFCFGLPLEKIFP